ncbi:MAG: hypothetical protein KC731_20940 [Myxococcales bacterium]|nr:hypothetical protein [Myxococcales bacterium]
MPAASRRLAGLLAALGALSAAPRPAEAQHKYALQLFHFNVQYVCGGTIGFTPQPSPELDVDNDALEDQIIVESLAPVVDLFEKHPTWGVDLEMQAYMLDIIAARHPELLAKLQAMTATGQIDVNSFHYSDQLFIGYPEEDWRRSNDLTRDTFDRHGVTLSKSVFCQEGQSAHHMGTRLAEAGYQTMVWPKNLWRYQHGDGDVAPLYRFGDALLVRGGLGASYDDGTTTIDLTWTFLDDGELLATGDINPYFPEIFLHDPAAVAEYEARLSDLEAQGYTIATVDQYFAAVEPLVTPEPAPPLLDGTWQPDTTVGVLRWMGGKGLWFDHERDNHVRTLAYQAHRELVAAETVAAEASVDARERLDAAWRLLFLGEVTDATGINPFRGEIQYGISHLAEALRIAREIVDEGKDALGLTRALIDPMTGAVSASEDEPFAGTASDPALALTIQGGDRDVTETWTKIADGHHVVTIDFGPGDWREVSVVFPGVLEDQLALGLALDDETPYLVERSAFTFEEFHFALPTGYIGLGDGRFVIKDAGQVHLAATVARDGGDVRFLDQTVDTIDRARWVFHVFDGTPEEAAQTAIAINSKRSLLR